MDALLVIDVDHGCDWSDRIEHMSETVSQRRIAYNIRNTIKAWRERKGCIIFTGYDPYGRNASQIRRRWFSRCIACSRPLGSDGRLARFLYHRHGRHFEAVFIKTDLDAFMNSDFAAYMRDKKISRLHIAGCQTFACVLWTARSAVRAGISVRLLRDCSYHSIDREIDARKWRERVMQAATSSAASIEIV